VSDPQANSSEAPLEYHLISSTRSILTVPALGWLLVILAIGLILFFGQLFLLSTNGQPVFVDGIFYDVTSIVLTLPIALAAALAITQVTYAADLRKAGRLIPSIIWILLGIGLGAMSSGCLTCSSGVLRTLGIGNSLATFPLGGLELKVLGLAILLGAIWDNSQIMVSTLSAAEDLFMRIDGDFIVIGRQMIRYLKLATTLSAVLVVTFLMPRVSAQSKAIRGVGNSATATETAATFLAEVNPPQGYTLSTHYGDIGPRLIAAGAIDQEHFVQLYASGGDALTDDQLHILTKGSDSPVAINSQNAHFLLNLFWALGLTNKNSILEQGPLMQASNGQIERFASTGGWTLGAKRASEVYSSTPILSLTDEQQARVTEAAANTYRPCCNNSTAFADCNHGMAMLGLFELMASQSATLDEMYQAAKYFNAFWFPQQSVYLAMYFDATTGQSFAELDPRVVVSAQYSSGSGANTVQQWLAQRGKLPQAPGGGSCSA
jgi:hypothetical protein